MKWYLAVLKKYATFKGRAHRTEYWMFILIHFAIFIGLVLLDISLGIGAAVMPETSTDPNAPAPIILPTIYYLAVLVPALAVGSRRLHDTGRKAWWLLLYVLPLIHPFGIIGPIVLIVFFCFNSQEGDNEYGPNPKTNPEGLTLNKT